LKRKQVFIESKEPENKENKVENIQEYDDLASSEGVDYTKLRDLLKEQKWKEANSETTRLMRKVAKRNLDPMVLGNFPRVDLCTIDRLWVKYSNGRFGFSVQKYIYYDCLGEKKYFDTEARELFSDRVGWRNWNGWTNDRSFNLTAPAGHLPNYISFEYDDYDDGSGRIWPLLEGNSMSMVNSLLSREDLPSTKPTGKTIRGISYKNRL
jgi:GUN4-like